MDWLDHMNHAMDYIEANLADEIDFNQAAKLACCSSYHFQRMFSFITNVPLSEYIRRRRLTLAAFELQSGETRVIDVALKYGYESPEAFSRAFKNLHDIMPSQARNEGSSLKAYPRMSFHISIKGDSEMNYRIEKKDEFEMFGIYGDISTDMEKAFVEVPRFCIQCDEDGTVDRMNELLGRSHDTMLHAALYDYRDTTFKYMICQYVPEDKKLPAEYTRLKVPTLTWAIFTPANTGEVPNTWRRIYSEWFPTSSYEQVEGPQFEMYYGKASNATAEVWIPVRKKD